ncbi:MAG: hypothetical protein RBS48_03395 [Ignavibacteriaceae bacterium]|jgi:hypothetical protein|nr:hypothetical protein [Ignavibacteriaceae bacterium]
MKRLLYGAVLYSLILTISVAMPQTSLQEEPEQPLSDSVTETFNPVFECEIDGNTFLGKIEEAALQKRNDLDYVQIKVAQDNKVLFLVFNISLLSGKEFPATLEYLTPDYDKGISPESEAIWLPEGVENAQWNTIDGESVILKYDPVTLVLEGEFEFEVQKTSYKYPPPKDLPTEDISKGKFSVKLTPIPVTLTDGN